MADPEMQRGDVLPDAIMRLMAGDDAFLAAHHAEAARRLTRLFDRALMLQRVTMSYDPTRIGGRTGTPRQGELADGTAEARRLLNGLAARMPGDCWGVLTDICGFHKGLQQVEQERNWPRRSAKLVLRIGLDHLASILALAPVAEGKARSPLRTWLPERPPMFAD